MRIERQKRDNANSIGNNHNNYNNISYNNDKYGFWRKWISRKSRNGKKHGVKIDFGHESVEMI